MTSTTDTTTETKGRPAGLITGWDALEFWVGNARATAGHLASMLGLEITAYAGPETGVTDRASYVLESGDLRFVVTAGLDPDSEITAHVRRHGDGVRDLSLAVTDPASAFEAAVARGAVPHLEPHEVTDEHGVIRRSAIRTFGDTIHGFVDRTGYHGDHAPGFTTEGLPTYPRQPAVNLRRIDHLTANFSAGEMQPWVEWYQQVMGFEILLSFDESQISTEFSALRSVVVADPDRRIVIPINEPAPGRRRSQIQEYVDTYRGPGVQHIAMRTDEILSTVAAMRDRGVRFLDAPGTYYEDVRQRLALLPLPWDRIEQLGVLVDDEPDGHLLQIFTENLGDRPTVFFEVIERAGARGFGEGNFKALFVAIEREQAKRGNLY